MEELGLFLSVSSTEHPSRDHSAAPQVADEYAEMSQDRLLCHLRGMRAVVAVTEAGTVRGAAFCLHVSQPAVSRALQELETVLSLKLFERASRGMVATPVGEITRVLQCGRWAARSR